MKTKYILSFIFILVVFSAILAQPTLPGTGNGNGNVEDNPIQFLIPIAIAIGAILGIKTIKKVK